MHVNVCCIDMNKSTQYTSRNSNLYIHTYSSIFLNIHWFKYVRYLNFINVYVSVSICECCVMCMRPCRAAGSLRARILHRKSCRVFSHSRVCSSTAPWRELIACCSCNYSNLLNTNCARDSARVEFGCMKYLEIEFWENVFMKHTQMFPCQFLSRLVQSFIRENVTDR